MRDVDAIDNLEHKCYNQDKIDLGCRGSGDTDTVLNYLPGSRRQAREREMDDKSYLPLPVFVGDKVGRGVVRK